MCCLLVISVFRRLISGLMFFLSLFLSGCYTVLRSCSASSTNFVFIPVLVNEFCRAGGTTSSHENSSGFIGLLLVRVLRGGFYLTLLISKYFCFLFICRLDHLGGHQIFPGHLWHS